MKPVVSARDLTKRYGSFTAVDHISFSVQPGRIVGLVGPNGAGKSTTLKAILGLSTFRGELQVLGMKPDRNRARLMQEVSYISDVAALPDWIRVDQLLRLMQDVHPCFALSRTRDFLDATDIGMKQRVATLSKGMKTQLHLALVMGVDARLLVLDEPTLGLDIIYRKKFYQQLLNEYFDEEKTIVVTTHQIEEIEHILSDVLFINRGHLLLNMPVEEIATHYVQLRVAPDRLQAARQLQPIHEIRQLDESVLIYEDVARDRLQDLGQLSTPNLADLFVAKVEGDTHA
ncbi:ABC transporter ATP-binding protein [Thiolapillus brandeum]|uniref:ABC-2 type transporter ATP-binding protein n=1 Tax=Thiolapillus brandeum TaxID=1076588 RepID=A0A7U6GHP7_9GAMM|nr:ABC transporter ATP-binding protein [Thiolapillus brandeum]BAO43812.1 ABC-2 type transporter ATP-binding protein [Thiolapillus brandeum]